MTEETIPIQERYHLGKIRLEHLNCCKCNKNIPKGSNCLFTRWTWIKYCLECSKKIITERIQEDKDEIKAYKKIGRKLNNERLIKENMCASLKL